MGKNRATNTLKDFCFYLFGDSEEEEESRKDIGSNYYNDDN
jgi:hypothetical protein